MSSPLPVARTVVPLPVLETMVRNSIDYSQQQLATVIVTVGLNFLASLLGVAGKSGSQLLSLNQLRVTNDNEFYFTSKMRITIMLSFGCW